MRRRTLLLTALLAMAPPMTARASMIILRPVLFARNSSAIGAGERANLDMIAAAFKGHPELVTVELQGFDNREPENLAKARAEAVLRELLARGVERYRLVPRDLGRKPSTCNEGLVRCRPRNRRVEFIITRDAAM